MPDARYPTAEEFWRRLEQRDVEPDLLQALRERTTLEQGPVQRAGAEATVLAVIKRLLPGSQVPARAIAAFLDASFDQQLGRGDERTGSLPRGELVPAGFAALDAAVEGGFASCTPERQDELLAQAERGELRGRDGFDSALWFNRVRDLAMLGFGADPRGMVQMGYPGPSYKPGHVWLGNDEVAARAARKRGYLEL
jgi:hypothetical protein